MRKASTKLRTYYTIKTSAMDETFTCCTYFLFCPTVMPNNNINLNPLPKRSVLFIHMLYWYSLENWARQLIRTIAIMNNIYQETRMHNMKLIFKLIPLNSVSSFRPTFPVSPENLLEKNSDPTKITLQNRATRVRIPRISIPNASPVYLYTSEARSIHEHPQRGKI